MSRTLKASVLLAGAVLGLAACSDSGTAPDASGDVGTMTNGTVSGATTGTTGTTGAPGTSGTTTMGGAVTSAAVTGSTTTSSVGAGGMSTSGIGGSTSGATTGGVAGAGMGGATMGGMGGATMGGMGGTGMAAGGTGSSGDEDIDMTGADFSCIGDWDRVSGFRITNLLGHLQEALDVANSPTGGVYPVGTVIQHLPTEAMVKRRTGFSTETRDWEFFLLELSSDGMTTIAERGTTEIQTSMGQTCVSCHSMPPADWDFVCNTWADSGGGDCGFDFMDSFLDMQLATDTRCN